MTPTSSLPITGLIIAKNEEDCIDAAVRSLAWLPEVVVVDCMSEDHTPQLARAAGARVVEYTYTHWDYSNARNFALTESNITTEWALFLDADEICPPQLANAICQTLAENHTNLGVYQLAGQYMFLGRWMKRTMGFPVWHDRLIRIGSGAFYGSPSEKYLCDYGYGVGRIYVPYIHHATRDTTRWLHKHNRYSSDVADEIMTILAQGSPIRRLFDKRELRKAIMLRASFYYLHIGFLYPLVRFFVMYVLKLGFLEGIHGLLLSVMYATYEAMITMKVTERKLLRAKNQRTPAHDQSLA